MPLNSFRPVKSPALLNMSQIYNGNNQSYFDAVQVSPTRGMFGGGTTDLLFIDESGTFQSKRNVIAGGGTIRKFIRLDSGRIIAYIEANGLFRTDDGGETWQNPATQPIAPDDSAPSFAANGDTIVILQPNRGGTKLMTSIDGGINWQVPAGEVGPTAQIVIYLDGVGFACLGANGDQTFIYTSTDGLNFSAINVVDNSTMTGTTFTTYFKRANGDIIVAAQGANPGVLLGPCLGKLSNFNSEGIVAIPGFYPNTLKPSDIVAAESWSPSAIGELNGRLYVMTITGVFIEQTPGGEDFQWSPFSNNNVVFNSGQTRTGMLPLGKRMYTSYGFYIMSTLFE